MCTVHTYSKYCDSSLQVRLRTRPCLINLERLFLSPASDLTTSLNTGLKHRRGLLRHRRYGSPAAILII
jgi:hypothetical protein